jgi:hypothetical protein
VLTAIAATSGCLVGPAVSGFLRAWPCARYATRLRIFRTFAASHLPPRAVANASPVESGGDLTERLRPCRLSLTYRGMGPRSATRNGLLRADQAVDEMNVTRQPIELGDSNPGTPSLCRGPRPVVGVGVGKRRWYAIIFSFDRPRSRSISTEHREARLEQSMAAQFGPVRRPQAEHCPAQRRRVDQRRPRHVLDAVRLGGSDQQRANRRDQVRVRLRSRRVPHGGVFLARRRGQDKVELG